MPSKQNLMNKSTKAARSSNIEILRLFCIIAIIADHFIGQSGILETTKFTNMLFYYAGSSLSRVACSVFVIISAWFLVDGKFKIHRVLHTWLTVFMYAIPLGIFCMIKGLIGREIIAVSLLPVERSPMWFASAYIIVVLLSPALNLLIKKAPRRIARFTIFVLLILLSTYTTVTSNNGYMTNDVWAMILIYLLSGYIKHYHKDDFVNNKKNISLKYLLIFFVTWFPIVFLRTVADYNSTSRYYILKLLSEYTDSYRAQFHSIPNIIMAFSLFFIFINLNVKSNKVINKMAGTTLGIYCFHQIPVWYGYLWSDICKAPQYADELHGIKRAIYTWIVILLIWLIGTGIELVRAFIADLLIEKRNYYRNICKSIDNLVDGLNEDSLGKNDKKLFIIITLVASLVFAVSKSIAIEHYWLMPIRAEVNLLEDSTISFKIRPEVTYDKVNNKVNGTVYITNTGSAIEAMSVGRYPIYLGISIVDKNNNEIDRDYVHVPVMTSGLLLNNEVTSVDIELQDKIEEYLSTGYDIRFEMVQEGIGWFEATAVNVDFDN